MFAIVELTHLTRQMLLQKFRNIPNLCVHCSFSQASSINRIVHHCFSSFKVVVGSGFLRARGPVETQITRVDSAMAHSSRLLLQLLLVMAVALSIAAQTTSPQAARPITSSAGAPVGGDLSLDNFEYQYGNTAGLVSVP
jgi:hypothetical protein